MRIGLLAADYGDGTLGVAFFKNVANAEDAQLRDEEFYNSEITEIDVPDDFMPPGFWRDGE